jgi:uncharacterized protein (DUF885 family)
MNADRRVGGGGEAGAGLQSLVRQWIDEEMREAPTRASALGLDGHDEELGTFEVADFERRSRADREWHDRLAAVPDDGLGAADVIDRDLVLSTLRGRLVLEDWTAWRRDPSVYLDPCLNGVFTLFLHRLLPEPELVQAAAARMKAVPDVLARAGSQLDPDLLSPVMKERARGQCAAGSRYFRELVPAEVDDPRRREALAEAGAEAAAAFEALGRRLEELDARGDFALGEERYSRLLEEREVLGYGAGELRDRGRTAWEDVDARLTEVAGRMGWERWQDALEEINTRRPTTPEEMLASYREMTERCRSFLIERDLVTIPEGEVCHVEPSPVFQRPVLAVASYAAPPPFKSSRTGHFFVPFPPEGTTPEQLAQRLATNSRAAMATISAHEAYPGHHWHFLWSQAHAPAVRSIVRTSYFVEGWALFAEAVMAEAGFFSDDAELLSHLDARIFRAARIVVDTSLHCGDMSFEEAVGHMHTHTGLSEATARAEVTRYCAWPTQAASYLTGALELERIRGKYVAAGRGDARRFNDAVAATGSLPLGLAERAVMAEG